MKVYYLSIFQSKAVAKRIYLDYAGATPIDPQVWRLISSLLRQIPGNASSVHQSGRQAGKIIENARKSVAGVLGVKKEEIIFTGSGSEANNSAILGFARANKNKGNHIVTTKIEHHSVLRACQRLEQEGFKVSYLDVDSQGLVDINRLTESITKKTILVSIGYANNEIGVIQPIKEIAETIKLKAISYKLKAVFHADACQAANYLNINCNSLGVDMLTLNSSKIYGPKGAGCLFIKGGLELEPIIYGGGQERGLRAGTENLALIAGFAKALEIAQEKKKAESERLQKLRDWTIDQILNLTSGARLNGHPVKRLPNNINISFANIDGEMVMLALDERGIEVSTGAACTATSTEPSHVIRALSLPLDLAKGNIRITLGRQTTKKDIGFFIKTLIRILKKQITTKMPRTIF